jgi:TRAP-type C4-dicarboxylate transport system permease small subunit
MDRASRVLFQVGRYLNGIAAVSLTVMMFLTVADVFLRAGSKPIIGTYEIVSILMGIVIGFAIPKVSLDRGHVSMEFLTDAVSDRSKAILITFTRILCIVLFILIGTNLIGAGNEFRISGEVSPTIQIPFYPVAYGVGICCFIECLVFVSEIVQIWKAKHE